MMFYATLHWHNITRLKLMNVIQEELHILHANNCSIILCTAVDRYTSHTYLLVIKILFVVFFLEGVFKYNGLEHSEAKHVYSTNTDLIFVLSKITFERCHENVANNYYMKEFLVNDYAPFSRKIRILAKCICELISLIYFNPFNTSMSSY